MLYVRHRLGQGEAFYFAFFSRDFWARGIICLIFCRIVYDRETQTETEKL